MPDTLFISYKSEENPFALQLAAGLKNHGVNVWIDRMDIQTGEEWDASIGAALRNCSGMIAILTPDYFRSHVCLDELHFAYANDRPILPLLLRNIFDERDHDIQNKIPFWLPRRQWLDFTDFLDDAAFQRQFDILLTRIQDEQQGVVGDRPAPEIQYLTSLIADLESQQGVENYIALAAQSEVVRVDPRPRKNVEPSLALLLKPPTPERDVRPATKKIDNIQQAVADHPKFVLIGDPGAGKTTTLRRLALEMARARLEFLTSSPRPMFGGVGVGGGVNPPIPFLVFLPRWSAEPTVADFIRRQWAATNMGGDVVRELQSGQVRLYLDGLNEMGGEGKKKAALLREWLQAANGPRYAVITCRQGDYHDDLKLGDLPTVLVEPLTDEKIREFAVQYLGEEQPGPFLEKVFPKSEWKIERSLIHLARNPYLLAALTLIFEYGGDLPRNTGALFHQLVMVLWERERLRQTPGWIPFEEMRTVFGNLAFCMIDEDQPIDVPLNYAEGKLGTADLLNIGRSANFITMDSNRMRFSHQLMLEYFASNGLLNVGLVTRVQRSRITIIGRTPTKWDEVVIASCGIVNSPIDLLQQFGHQDPYLAVECIASGIEVDGSDLKWLVEIFGYDIKSHRFDVRIQAARALVTIGQPQIMAFLMAALHDPDEVVRSLAVEGLGKVASIDSYGKMTETKFSILYRISRALKDPSTLVHCQAARQLGKIGGKEAVSYLLDVLYGYGYGYEESAWLAAIEALGDIGELCSKILSRSENATLWAGIAKTLDIIEDPSTVSILIQLLSDKRYSNSKRYERVCDVAAEALVKIGTLEALEAVKRWREEQGEQ